MPARLRHDVVNKVSTIRSNAQFMLGENRSQDDVESLNEIIRAAEEIIKIVDEHQERIQKNTSEAILERVEKLEKALELLTSAKTALPPEPHKD